MEEHAIDLHDSAVASTPNNPFYAMPLATYYELLIFGIVEIVNSLHCRKTHLHVKFAMTDAGIGYCSYCSCV